MHLSVWTNIDKKTNKLMDLTLKSWSQSGPDYATWPILLSLSSVGTFPFFSGWLFWLSLPTANVSLQFFYSICAAEASTLSNSYSKLMTSLPLRLENRSHQKRPCTYSQTICTYLSAFPMDFTLSPSCRGAMCARCLRAVPAPVQWILVFITWN